MRKLSLFLLAFVVLTALASPSQACLTCSGANCVFVSTGHGACTTYPDPDLPCKLSCPGCPTEPCDPPDPGGGGGGGGGCALFDLADARGQIAPAKSVVTSGLLFRSDAATNAQLFGGRGHGYRLLAGEGFGDFTVDAAVRAIDRLSPGAATRLAVGYGFTNVNNAGIPTSFHVPGGEGFGFAPSTHGLGASLQIKVRGMSHLARALGDVNLSSQDLLLVDVSLRGKAYILVLKSDVLDDAAPDATSRLQGIQDALRDSYRLSPNPYRVPIEVC